MFTYKTTIKLHQTDAAGILFFSHQFEIIHDAYEALLEKMGLGFPSLLSRRNFFLPIVHAEADYKAPLFVGDRITVTVRVESVGTTSFVFAYTLIDQRKRLVGTARTVHVTVDKKSKRKIPLPSDVRKAVTRRLASR